MWEALGEYQGPPIFKVLVHYMAARLIRKHTQSSYRKYVTESLRLAPQMSYLSRSWTDAIESARRKREPEQTAEEIVDGVIDKLEGMFA